jgi:hypothetical protein
LSSPTNHLRSSNSTKAANPLHRIRRFLASRKITRFYGIIIKIFFRNEHNPPHIHAIYGEHNGLFSIKDMQMIEGDLPARAVKLVQEWGKPLSEELQKMWDTKQLKKLPPLK